MKNFLARVLKGSWSGARTGEGRERTPSRPFGEDLPARSLPSQLAPLPGFADVSIAEQASTSGATTSSDASEGGSGTVDVVDQTNDQLDPDPNSPTT